MSAANMRIAVYGAGAMGTVLGALLTKGGCQNVQLITRNEKHVTALNEKGAIVHCTAENQTLKVAVNALLPSQMQGKYDVVFLMTKQRNNAETLQNLLPFLHENSVVCTTQNGLPEPSVLEVVGGKRTYGAVTSFGATFVGNGEVEMTSRFEAMSMEIGGYQNDGEKTELLTEILAYAGAAVNNQSFVKSTQNLAGARWSKLAINAAFSGLSTATGLTFGQVAKRGKTRKIALAVIRECIAVAHANGVVLANLQGADLGKWLGGNSPLKRAVAYLVLPYAMRKHKKLLSGMLMDVRRGKKCEIDFINGLVCREGKRVGVETPMNTQLTEMVHGIENGLYEIDYRNVDFFEV